MSRKTLALDSNDNLSVVRPEHFKSKNVSFETEDATHLNTVKTIYVFLEFIGVACSAYVAGTIYHFIILQSTTKNPEYIIAAIVIASLVLFISLAFHNFTRIRRQTLHLFLWRGLGSVAMAFSIFLTILFFAQLSVDYSRGTFIFQIVGVSAIMTLTRAFFYQWLQSAIASNRIEARRIVLIGDNDECLRLAEKLRGAGIKTVGFFRFPKSRRPEQIANSSKTRELISEIRSKHADDIFILAGDDLIAAAIKFAAHLGELPSGVHIVPINSLNTLASSQVADFGNVRTIQVIQPPLSRFDLVVKRTFDVVFASAALIILSPLFLLVSIAIKLDTRGPVFFRQTRHGFNNEEIRVLKFRSMVARDCQTEFAQTKKNDPRVTTIGYLIRKTNIDELPQLINVLRGDMSIVGPRPHATAHNALYDNVIMPFSRRHNVRPGITGWAQINGHRGATDTLEKMRQRIEFDLYYIDNWSFLLDIRIIVATLFSKKAYLNAY